MSCPGCGYGNRWSGWEEDEDVDGCPGCHGSFCGSCVKVPVSVPVLCLRLSLYWGVFEHAAAQAQSCHVLYRSKDTQACPQFASALTESLQGWDECEKCGERSCNSCSEDWERCEECDTRGCCLDLSRAKVKRPHAECEVPRRAFSLTRVLS